MKKTRTTILALLCAAVTLLTGWLAVYGLRAEPLLLSEPEPPEDAVAQFMDAVCAGDLAAAQRFCDGWTFSDQTPEEDDARLVYAVLAANRSWEPLSPAQREGIVAEQTVRLRCVDLASLTEGIGEGVEARLAGYVDSARTVSEIYDEQMNYRPEVVERAWAEELQSRLDRPEDHIAARDITLTLRYEGRGWLIACSDELLSALAGGV